MNPFVKTVDHFVKEAQGTSNVEYALECNQKLLQLANVEKDMMLEMFRLLEQCECNGNTESYEVIRQYIADMGG
jgi:hypothetical protein